VRKTKLLVVVAAIASLAAVTYVYVYIQSASLEYKCASHLNQIGVALRIYASENDGHLPSQLETLVACDLLKADRLRPIAPLEPFVYSPPEIQTGAPDDILVHEPVANHRSRGTHILRRDGSIEWISAASAHQRALRGY
jgi:hypothetical protein